MMAEIEAGHIGVVIVKDMSRFGRDYLQVGYYTEMFFPERGIRFIAVVNDVDSKKPSSSNDFLPFLNVMNENLSLRRENYKAASEESFRSKELAIWLLVTEQYCQFFASMVKNLLNKADRPWCKDFETEAV